MPKPTSQDSARIKWLKEVATDHQVLSLWRFEPSSSAWLEEPTATALFNRYRELRNRLSAEDYSALSKSIGWDPY